MKAMREMKRYIKFKKIIALLITAGIVFTLAAANAAGRTEEDINAQIAAANAKAEKLLEENKRLEAEIRSVQGDKSQLEQQKKLIQQRMDNVQERISALSFVIDMQIIEIENKQADIEALEERIKDTEYEIVQKGVKIAQLEAENKDNLEKFGQLVKEDYMTGGQSYLDLFVDATDFFDLIVRAEVLNRAGERNLEFMDDLLAAIEDQEKQIEELEEMKAALQLDIDQCEIEKAEYEAELAELYSNMSNLDAEMSEEQTLLLDLASDIEDIQSEINSMYRQYNATSEEIEELEALTMALIKEKQNLNRPDYSGDGFRWPLDSKFRMITCKFGYDSWRGGMHYGTDIGNAGINGANIYAMQSGTVIVATSGGGYGYYVIIDHGGGTTTLYAHMQKGSIAVSVGQEITKGTVIGKVGSTGWSTGPHLHFEVRVNGTAKDPMSYSYEYW